jgi:signal peptide peptidase SppA
MSDTQGQGTGDKGQGFAAAVATPAGEAVRAPSPLLDAAMRQPGLAAAAAQFLAEMATPPLLEGRAEAAILAGTYRTASGRSGMQARVETKDGSKGVSVITISGPLSYRGGVDYESIASEINRAAADASTGAILLRLDSPGGDAAMVDVAGAAIRQANKAKPVVAFVDPHAFSAAYWLASQASRVVMGPGAMVGSVGVISRHFDLRGLAEKFGVKITEFTYGDKKNLFSLFREVDEKATSDADRILKAIGDDFVAAVAAGRGISEKEVRATQAAVFTAQQALDNGFADASAHFADLLAEMQADLTKSRAAGARAEAAGETPEAEQAKGEGNMATENKGTAAEAQTSQAAAPPLPEKQVAASVDTGALLKAMAGYGLDGNALAVQISEAAASTDDAIEIAQAYAIAGKPEASLKMLQPGAKLTAKQFRSTLVNARADAGDKTEVNASVQAHEGLRGQPARKPLYQAVQERNPEYKPAAWVSQELARMTAQAGL